MFNFSLHVIWGERRNSEVIEIERKKTEGIIQALFEGSKFLTEQ